MGGEMSKKTPETSYEAACKLNTHLQSFDATLIARTNHVNNTIADGVEDHSLSFEFLKQATECLFETQGVVLKEILDHKKDIWEDEELFELVEEYFDNSLRILRLCTALKKCLKGVRNSQLFVLRALKRFEEEKVSGTHYAKTLEELKNFKAAGDPFTKEFVQIFQSICNKHTLMNKKLQVKQNQLGKKIKQIRVWRKVSSAILIATVAAVSICLTVMAVMGHPNVATQLNGLVAPITTPLAKFIDNLKNYENALKGQKGVTVSMRANSYVAIKELNNIQVLIEQLKDEIEYLLQNVDLAVEGEGENMKAAIEEIKNKLEAFTKNVEELEVQTDTCSRNIIRARTVILQKMAKLPQG